MTTTIELDVYNRYQKHLPNLDVAVTDIFNKVQEFTSVSDGSASHVYKLISEATLRSIVGNYLLADSLENDRDPIFNIYTELVEEYHDETEICLVDLAQDMFMEAQDELTDYIACLELNEKIAG